MGTLVWHLGHVFSDELEPTCVKYCIHCASLNYKPEKDENMWLWWMETCDFDGNIIVRLGSRFLCLMNWNLPVWNIVPTYSASVNFKPEKDRKVWHWWEHWCNVWVTFSLEASSVKYCINSAQQLQLFNPEKEWSLRNSDVTLTKYYGHVYDQLETYWQMWSVLSAVCHST